MGFAWSEEHTLRSGGQRVRCITFDGVRLDRAHCNVDQLESFRDSLRDGSQSAERVAVGVWVAAIENTLHDFTRFTPESIEDFLNDFAAGAPI